jgi:prepilin-type N-terminal cleavage/methylation domain-containing protein
MKREQGFTLIEIIMALAIGSIILTMIFTSLNAMIRSRQTVLGYSTPYAIGPQILDTIEADLKNAYFYDFKENDSFWGADGEIIGHEADGISFLTASLGRIGEESIKSTLRIGQEAVPHSRRAPTSEVQYVCRQSKELSETLELWRREDFYVDDSIHEGGVYRLVCDRVFDFKLEYVSRSTSSGGLSGNTDKSIEQMRRDGWSSIEERGLPRAVIATISIYGREHEKNWEKEPEVFVFRRWIPLPQVHMSPQSEGQIATWDGKIEDKGAPVGPGKNRGARGSTTTTTGHGSQTTGQNPFGAALGNRAPRGGGGGGNNPFGALFRPK